MAKNETGEPDRYHQERSNRKNRIVSQGGTEPQKVVFAKSVKSPFKYRPAILTFINSAVVFGAQSSRVNLPRGSRFGDCWIALSASGVYPTGKSAMHFSVK